ncbi:adenosine-5'-phosphosulfate kinase, mitochondrial [Pelomyxa schiedti]|nr:adenosine-5'-phosphosulfate kinase, mitochondrial [Pelomyxa schiedti]
MLSRASGALTGFATLPRWWGGLNGARRSMGSTSSRRSPPKALVAKGADLGRLKAEVVAGGYPDHVLTGRQLTDVELVLTGAFSPLGGFMNKSQYESVVKRSELPDGTLWPIPITLDVSAEIAEKAKKTKKISLRDDEGRLIAVMDVEDIWKADKDMEAREVFGTTDIKVPGVAYLKYKAGDWNVGGRIVGAELPVHYSHKALRGTPQLMHAKFDSMKWNKVAAFHSRKVLTLLDREALTSVASNAGAKLLIQAEVGLDPIYHSKVKCLTKIMPTFEPNTAMLSLLSLSQRGIGLRDQLLKCIVARNHGCSHFIADVPRPLFSQLEKMGGKAGVDVLGLPKMAYVKNHRKYYNINAVPDGEPSHTISESELETLLRNGKHIPEWLLPSSAVSVLKRIYPPNSQKGVCIFFTGLSGSGKSTIGNQVCQQLMEDATRQVVMLDGDVVRHNLSKGLGFSKEDRDLNILRIGFVASLITKCGGAVICAPIAPYANIRRKVREMVTESGGLFVQVHVATSLEECEKRDTKGLYAKARQGKLKNFTGIDDPYEIPKNSEVSIRTEGKTIEQSADQVWQYLVANGIVDSKN